jgi:methyltransferase (TIGR00027 family)
MEGRRPSGTAMMAAIGRAAHLLLDDDPKILRDDLALRFSGAENEGALRAALETQLTEPSGRTRPDFAQAVFKFYRAFVTMRNRYAEDELSKAIHRGVTQYVILGAGLDSFAYRRRDLAGVLHIFEVDHPATQQWKRARLREFNIALPDNLTFLPVDFERQRLGEVLRAGRYQIQALTFFSWLGVTQYLTEKAIFGTLQEVASSAPGSEVVFEYSLPESLLDEENRQMLATFKAMTAARGEPWLSLFEPARLAARLKELGFAQVWDFGPEEANARYFAGRTDGLGLRVTTTHLMKARVGSLS